MVVASPVEAIAFGPRVRVVQGPPSSWLGGRWGRALRWENSGQALLTRQSMANVPKGQVTIYLPLLGHVQHGLADVDAEPYVPCDRGMYPRQRRCRIDQGATRPALLR